MEDAPLTHIEPAGINIWKTYDNMKNEDKNSVYEGIWGVLAFL